MFNSRITRSLILETLARYACWISSQASLATSLEQKLTGLSRRTAAEFRKAEGERLDLQHRVQILEATLRGILNGETPDLTGEKGAAASTWPVKTSPSVELQALMATEQRREELARRFAGLEEQVAQMSQEFCIKIHQICRCDEVKTLCSETRSETSRLQSTLRDEVRIVHNEVMSLDARVSLLEEQGITSIAAATPELLKRDRQGFRQPGSGRQDVPSPAQRASHAQEGGESGDGK